MSKTLEELGYDKIVDDSDMVRYKKSGEPINYFISFYKDTKTVEANEVCYCIDYPSELEMEELKAIYKYCEDNKWI